jgi:hypothetical protein
MVIMTSPNLGSLLSKGYFPRELPPPFTTAAYARYARKVGSSWPTGTWTRCVTHNLARPGGLRRPLRIPNPLSYFALASIIAANWNSIKSHTWKQTLSASRPYALKASSRAVVPRYRYGELTRLRALRRRSGRYLLLTDIDQFYPTIYTHTIPWALHTKAACKAALKPKKGKKPAILLGDTIDKALQRMNEGQTHGIPIGPDTSLVVAEILLAAADEMLVARKAGTFSGFRYVDDYELSFQSLSGAEEALVELQAILATFELNLNPKKTRIVDLPRGLDSAWSIELKSINIRAKKAPVAHRNDMLALFSRAFELAAAHPSESVLRYAVSHVQRLDVNSSVWRSFHNCVLSAASADPSTLPVALGTLYEVARLGGHEVPKGPLSEVLESVISRHAPRAQGSEVAWALWGALAWDVNLSNDAALLVDAMEDDVVALLAMHAAALGLFPRGALTKNSWAALVAQPDALEGEHWLLAYEANQQGWLTTPAIKADPTFSAMSSAGVSFYEQTNRRAQFPEAGRAAPGGMLWDNYA